MEYAGKYKDNDYHCIGYTVFMTSLVSHGIFNPMYRPLFSCLLGRGRIPRPLNYASVMAMTMRLRGSIVRPKMFPLRSKTGSYVTLYDVIITSRLQNGGHLGFLYFSKTSAPKLNEK